MVFGFPSLGIGGKVIGLNHRHRLCFQANCLPNSAVHLSPSSEAFFFDCSHISSVRQVWRLKKENPCRGDRLCDMDSLMSLTGNT